MMNDLQQKSALSSPPIAPPCSSNGGFDNNIITNSSSSCFPPSYPWGTWEDLLLASAVLKHGMDNWSTVSCELQARAFLVPPSLFSAEACKVRFWILNGRFSSCNNGTVRDGKIPWFEEVRKLRVAQLKRELERYDGSIGLLQKKLNRLKAENAGSEAVVSREDHEQNNPSSFTPEEAIRCLRVCSTGDRMPAESSFGTSSLGCLSEPELVQSSCATASPVIRGSKEVQETILVPDLKESLTSESADHNLASNGCVIDENTDHNMNLGGIPDQYPSVCLNSGESNRPSTIEVGHNPHEPQICPCSLIPDEKSSVKTEDAEHESNVQDGASSFRVETKSWESEVTVISSQDDHASDLGGAQQVNESGHEKLEDRGLALQDTCPLCCPLGLDRLIDNDVACTSGELGQGVECISTSCASSDLSANSTKCVIVPPSSATKLADSVVEDNAVQDSLLSANAMDLLRIAYADGTPVSTPEEVDTQPVEPEKTEESEGSYCLCPGLLPKLAISEPDLFCCSLDEVPHQGKIGELQTAGHNQTLGIQTKVPSVVELTPMEIDRPNPAFASVAELLSEQTGCQVADMAGKSLALSMVPNILNLVETTVEKAYTGQPHNVGGSLLFPDGTCKLDLDSKSLNSEKGETSPPLIVQEGSITHEIQDLRKGAGSDRVEHFERLGRECSVNANSGPCSQMDKVISGESYGVAFAADFNQEVKSEATFKDVSLPAKVESSAISPSKFGSHMDSLGEHPTISVSKLQKGSQLITCGIQSVVELKEDLSCSAIHCEKETMELAQAASQRCERDTKLVCGNIPKDDDQTLNATTCHSDGKNSTVEAICEFTNKQQEINPDCAMQDSPLRTGKGTLKASRSNAERMVLEVNAESKTNQAKLKEGSDQVVRCKPSGNACLSSPRSKSKHRADIDALEDDGLLVDLMKLKDTDLTTLRKRKHLHRGGSNAERRIDYGLSNNGLGESIANKYPKLSRFQEDKNNEISISTTQSKNLSKVKHSKYEFSNLDSSKESSDRAVVSSNVSSLDSDSKFGSKESAVEVFSTRRSRLKLRKLESPREEPDKTKMQKDGSVQRLEAVVLDAADKEASELEISGVLPPVNNEDMIADNGLLPDLLLLLECLRSISGHRFAPLFNLRPEIQNDARYRGLVKRHMDLNTVRSKLEEGMYSGSLEFFRDMMLIFSNALVFYSRDSQEYGAALVLRESLIREMDRFLREESPHRSSAATQAVKYGESKVLKNLNIGCGVSTCDGNRQASFMSSCDPTISEIGLHGEDCATEVTSGTGITTQDHVLGNRACVKDLDSKKKELGDLASSKAFNKTKTVRKKALGAESGLNRETFDREKQSRNLEDVATDLSTERESVKVLKRSHQASSRMSREYRKDSSDKSRSSKYSSDRPSSLSQGRQGEPRKSLGSERSSRSAQPSKLTHLRGTQSYSQPQKRART